MITDKNVLAELLLLYRDKTTPESHRSLIRKRLCKGNIPLFCEIYLPELFSFNTYKLNYIQPPLPADIIDRYRNKIVFNKINHVIWEECLKLSYSNLNLAIAMPRGHGKTTSVLAYIIYALAYEEQEFILYLSSSINKTKNYFANIGRILKFNRLLLTDFPHLKPMKQPDKNVSVSFNATTIILEKGILSMGSRGASPRGLNINGIRPSIAILDDIDNMMSVYTQHRIENTKDWFRGEILPLGDATGVSIFYIYQVVSIKQKIILQI